MTCRHYLVLLLIILSEGVAKAQVRDVAQADSISENLYLRGDWKKLISFGEQAIASGKDFLILRERIAYACFVTEDYKGALEQYNQILKTDSYNLTARYYSYYSNLYLNNSRGAGVDASYLDTATLRKENIGKYNLINLATEVSTKLPQNSTRGTGFYSRAGLSNRIGWHLQLEQSVSYFSQNIFTGSVTAATGNGLGNILSTSQAPSPDNQFEYYIKGSYSLTDKLSLMGAYHYLNTSYLNTSYNNNLGFAGLNYTGNRYIDLQADVSFGNIFSANTTQYDGQLTYYPNGNLNLYTISRASVKNTNSKNSFVFNQALGFKVANKTWLEGTVTVGDLENYADMDALYIYNAIDNTKFKTGATLFYQFNLHTMLQIGYTYETKYDIYKNINYAQHAVSAGIIWKF